MSFLKFSALIDSCLQMGIGYVKLELNTEYKDNIIRFPVIFLWRATLQFLAKHSLGWLPLDRPPQCCSVTVNMALMGYFSCGRFLLGVG